MSYQSNPPAAGTGYTNPIGQEARALKLGPPTLARGPSLEDRLEHLQRGLERLCKVRSGLDAIADRICLVPEAAGHSGGIAPTPSDLTGRFGETISAVHNQLDVVEQLVERIYFGLFSSSNQAECAR